MVSLVIEKMVERRGKYLFDILRIDDGAVADRLGKIVVVQGADILMDTSIFSAPGRAQLREIIIEDRIEARRDFALVR